MTGTGTVRRMICLACLLCGLTVTAAPALARSTHTVEIRVARQETLIGICKRYLEQPETWRKIAKLNRLADPDRISPGQRLKFPVEMLKGVPLTGTVTLLSGETAWKAAGEAVWAPLKLKDTVKAGSSLMTGRDGAVEITFEDGTSFLLRENSGVTVTKAGQGALHMLRTLYLESGKVISRIKSATGRDSRFEVETPSALAAARGTEFRIGVDKGRTTWAESIEHSIDVSSGKASIMLSEGEGSIVRMNEAPTPPVRLLPPPEPEGIAAVYGDRKGEIRFSKIPGAARYRVVLARDREGKQAVRTGFILPEEAFRFEGLADGSYYLASASIDTDGLEGGVSRPEAITVRRKPHPPTLVSPLDKDQLPEMPLKIRWHNVVGVAAYQMQISANRDFSGDLFESGDLRKTEYIPKALPAGSYHLRVRSLAEDGYAGDWSEPRAFSIIQLPPPSVRKPDDDDKRLYLEWEALRDATGYRLQIARDEAFSAPILDRMVAESKFVLENPPAPGKYYMRVSAANLDLGAGGFSKSGSFEIEQRKHYFFEALGGAGVVGAVLLLLLL